jgi:hypothetical protein
MNTANWNLVFKVNYNDKKVVETNLVYTPMTNDDNSIYCMNFDHSHPYQNEMVASFMPERPYYTKETVQNFFNREIYYLEKFKDFKWRPNYIKIDNINNKIFFEWPGESCNKIVTDGGNLEIYCPNWEQQLINIIMDIYNHGFYKVTLYPHCFFVQNGILKTFDFYGCANIEDPYVPLSIAKGVLGVASKERFIEVIKDEKLNFKVLFKQALEGYSCWPTEKLKELIGKIF